jgi:hypothetical protein
MRTSSPRYAFALPCSLVFALIAATAAGDEKKDISDAPEKSLLLVAAAPAKPDTKKYELRYKLKRGDVLRYEVTHRASIRSTIDTTTQAAQTKTDSVKAWKVTDLLPGGDIEFTSVVEKVHMVNQLPDKDPTEYDSTTDKIAPPGFEDAAKAVGVPLSVMRITSQGKVVRRDVKVRNQAAEDDAPIVPRLPEEKVSIGDTWDEPFEVQVKLDKTETKMIQTRRHHKLTDVKNGVATIAVTYQVLSPIDAKIETQIVQRLMEGEVRFDIEKGHVLGQAMDIDKRIIGFAGPTSSMQYVMKMEEKLLQNEKKMASATPEPKSRTKTSNSRPANKTTKSQTQTASRPRNSQSSSRTQRR